MSSADFLVIGDTQYDTIMVPERDEVEILSEVRHEERKIALDFASKIPVVKLVTMVAGNAANVAVSGARLNGSTAFWTLLGDDMIAGQELAHFQREGINTTWVQRVPGAQSNQSTVISVDGERTILVYHAPRVYRLPSNLPRAHWAYLTSMAPGSETIIPDLVTYLDHSKTKLAYQPGTHQLRLGAERSRDLLAATTVIVMNKEEAQSYTGQRAEQSIPVLCQALHALGPRIVVVTDGTNGSFASDESQLWKMGIRPEIKRVEATGAGDAYSAAFTLALLHDQPIPEALRWGALNAESVIGQFGPQAGILTKAQLTEQLASNPQFIAEVVQGVS